MTRTFRTKISIGDADDQPIIVHYTAHPARRGCTDGKWGPKLEPDEPAYLEIDRVILEGEHDLEIGLDDYWQERVELEIAEHLDGLEEAARGRWE